MSNEIERQEWRKKLINTMINKSGYDNNTVQIAKDIEQYVFDYPVTKQKLDEDKFDSSFKK